MDLFFIVAQISYRTVQGLARRLNNYEEIAALKFLGQNRRNVERSAYFHVSRWLHRAENRPSAPPIRLARGYPQSPVPVPRRDPAASER